LNLDAWENQNPGRETGMRPSKQIVLSLDALSYRTGSGTPHPVVKERAPLSGRKANRQSESIAGVPIAVNIRVDTT
jgi:hypothetical protein